MEDVFDQLGRARLEFDHTGLNDHDRPLSKRDLLGNCFDLRTPGDESLTAPVAMRISAAALDHHAFV
jgi:hypothetical protein